MTQEETETPLNQTPPPEPKPIFPRLAPTDETDSTDGPPLSTFDAILDAYAKDPDRWDGLE